MAASAFKSVRTTTLSGGFEMVDSLFVVFDGFIFPLFHASAQCDLVPYLASGMGENAVDQRRDH